MTAAINLRRKLVLEGVTRQPDNAGGFTEAWSQVGTVWADFRSLSGRVRETGSVTLSYTPYRIVVRAAPQNAASRPVAGQRFRDGSRIFNIRAVTEYDPNGMYLDCSAVEEVAT